MLAVDPDGRVMMFHGYDPDRPDEPYWFTAGGGAEPSESLAEAAARELREESGIIASAADLGEPVWHEVTEFPFAGLRYRQEQDFFLLRVDGTEVTMDGMDDGERESVRGHRWWSAADLAATTEAYYPAELPGLLRHLLGQPDAEPG